MPADAVTATPCCCCGCSFCTVAVGVIAAVYCIAAKACSTAGTCGKCLSRGLRQVTQLGDKLVKQSQAGRRGTLCPDPSRACGSYCNTYQNLSLVCTAFNQKTQLKQKPAASKAFLAFHVYDVYCVDFAGSRLVIPLVERDPPGEHPEVSQPSSCTLRPLAAYQPCLGLSTGATHPGEHLPHALTQSFLSSFTHSLLSSCIRTIICPSQSCIHAPIHTLAYSSIHLFSIHPFTDSSIAYNLVSSCIHSFTCCTATKEAGVQASLRHHR